MIERLVAILDGDTILLEDIPIEYRLGSFQQQQQHEGMLEKATEAFQQSFILKALEREGWIQVATAKAL
jgi:DNA-binding NtrC family response regulator